MAATGHHEAMGTPANRLGGETSPYLRQHAHNPVDWHPWGPEALAKARAEDKPIFLSIGYSACHWCHVMERESFESAEIASFLNAHFVSIKVDREERPDLDEIYMAAVLALNGNGGWPMSVFLTPDLAPFFGGTYFPPEDRHGHPGFKTILRGVIGAWRERRFDVMKTAQGFAGYLGQCTAQGPGPGFLTVELGAAAEAQLSRSFEPVHGGWDSGPKFPSSGAIGVLLRQHRHTGDAHSLRMALHTLDRMAGGGLYDHLGGGFHRYTVDAAWRVPHFEKMLYDNAQLAQIYIEAYQATRKARYRRVAEETLDYVLRDMQAPHGGFYSSEDADSAGEEGRFYIWSKAEIIAALGPEDGEWFCARYGVTDTSNFASHESYHAGQNILYAPGNGEETDSPETTVRDAAVRNKLLAVRARRERPGRDDKILTSWNGLMITALAQGAQVFGENRYADAAVGAAEFLLANMNQAGVLRHSHCRGESRVPGFLDDYAFLANGFLDLYAATFDSRWIDEAERLAGHMAELFWDTESGGFFFTGKHHTDVLVRTKPMTDGVEPSGNSGAALMLLRLGRLTGEVKYEEMGRRVLDYCAASMARMPMAYLKMLWAADFALDTPHEIVLAGHPGDASFHAFLKALHSLFLPNKTVACAPSAPSTAAAAPLAAGKTSLGGKTTAYVCRNHTCGAPITSLDEFSATLTAIDGRYAPHGHSGD